MDDEIQDHSREVKDEEEGNDIDVSQKSILSFFKPVSGRFSKPLPKKQRHPSEPDENICCSSYDDKEKQPMNMKSMRTKSKDQEDQEDLSLKSKQTTSSMKDCFNDSGVLSISSAVDEVDLSRTSVQVKQKKSRKKKHEDKGDKYRGIHVEEDHKDGMVPESQSFNNSSEKELGNADTDTFACSFEFSSQVKDVMETGNDKNKLNKRRKSQRMNCKKNIEEKEISTSCKNDLEDRSSDNFSRKKKRHLKGTEEISKEESMEGYISVKKSVVGDNETGSSDNEYVKLKNATEGGMATGKREKNKRRKKKRKEQIIESEEEDQFLQKFDEQVDSNDILVRKVDGRRLSKADRIKSRQECEFEAGSAGVVHINKEEFVSRKSNRRRIKGLSVQNDYTELKETDGSLRDEDVIVNNVIEGKMSDKDIGENEKKLCAVEELKAEVDFMLLQDTNVENEVENVKEDEQLDGSKGGKSLKKVKRMVRNRKKIIGGDTMDFDYRVGEKITIDTPLSDDELANDCTHVLSRRRRRRKSRSVNYMESPSVDDDDDYDDDFQPQLRKSASSNAHEKRTRLKSSIRGCYKKSSELMHEDKSESRNENECTRVRNTKLAQPSKSTTDFLMDSKKDKVSDTEDGNILTGESKDLKEPAANCATTSFLAKFAKQKIMKCEENSIVEEETALPLISHTLQLSICEREWYQNATSRLISCSTCLGPNQCVTLPLVARESDWGLLANLPRPSRGISTKTQQFVSLAIAITDMLKCDPALPLLKLLKSYVNCQMNVVKQCLAKVEIPKSTLKSIWEKQGKPAKGGVAAVNPIEIQPVKQGIDIRTMFKKANSQSLKESKSIKAEDMVPAEEKGSDVADGIEMCDAGGMQPRADANKNSRKKKKEMKKSGKERGDIGLDSSVEIVSKEDAVLKSCNNTIEESFTKISKKGQSEKKVSDGDDRKEICDSERKMLNSSLVLRSKKASSESHMTVDEDFVIVEEEADKMISSRKSKRNRRGRADKSEAVDYSGNEAEKKKDTDCAEKELTRKKRGKRKRKTVRGGGNEDSVNEVLEDKTVSESNVSPSLSDQVERGRKRIRKIDAGRKGEEDLPTTNESIDSDQCSKIAQHDIRTMFGNAKCASKEKEFTERSPEFNNQEQCRLDILEKDVILAEVVYSSYDKIEEPHHVTQQKEIKVVEEQKSETIDIRRLFRKGSEKGTNSAKVTITEESPASVLSVEEVEMKGSCCKGKTVISEDGNSHVGSDIGKYVEEKEMVNCIEYYKEEVGISKDEKAMKLFKVEDGKQKHSEVEGSGSAFDMKAKESEPHIVVSTMDIASYFKPPAGKSRKKSDAVSAQSSDLKTLPLESGSFSKRSEINDVCRADSETRTLPSRFPSWENMTGPSRGEQDKSSAGKPDRIEASSEDKSEGEFRSIDEMIPGDDKKTARADNILSVANLKQKNRGDDLVIYDQNEKGDFNSEKVISKLCSSSAEQCVRIKRKRDSNPILGPLDKMALDEYHGTAIGNNNTMKAKRIKVDEDAEVEGTSCNVSLKVNSVSLNKNHENVQADKSNMIKGKGINLELQISQSSEEAAMISSLCDASNCNNGEQAINVPDIANNSDDEIMAFHAKQINPVSLTGTCSTASSSSSEESNDSTEAVCDSEADIVSIIEFSDSERGSNEHLKSANGSEMQVGIGNGRLDTEIISNGVISGRDVRLERESVSLNRAEGLVQQIDCSDETEEAYVEDFELKNEATRPSIDKQTVVVSCETNCCDIDLKTGEKKGFQDLPKRTRSSSFVSHDDKIPEENGRRRSSRVKQREDERLEAERRRKEELEKISLERIDSKITAVKKRKPCKASNSALKNEAAGDEASGSKRLVLEDSKTDYPAILADGASVPKRENTADVEVVKVIELPLIDEDYINSSLLWTEKYAPARHDQVIGNRYQTQQIFDWLSLWKEKHEHFVMKFNAGNNSRSRGRTHDTSDSGDSSDEDDEEFISNTFVVVGKIGCGSTATVYACAQELGYKVLEMHPSNYRSGKQIQALLGEATQSHQVKRKFHGSGGDNSLTANEEAQGSKNICSFFGSRPLGNEIANSEKKNENAKETEKRNEESCKSLKDSNHSNHDVIGGEMSLILFEQVDVVFDEQDKGFWFGLNELRRQAKRPIIITTNDPSAKTRLDGDPYEVVTLHYAEEQIIVDHLIAMCLAENVTLPRILVENTVKNFHRDIRKSILKLQFMYEQWIKPCYGKVGCAIKKLSKMKDMKDANERENLLDRNAIQNSVTGCSDSTYDNRQLVSLEDENSKVTSYGSQIKDLPHRESMVRDVELNAPVIARSIQGKARDVKIKGADESGSVLSQKDLWINAQAASRELSACECESVKDDVDMKDGTQGEGDFTRLAKEEAFGMEKALVKEEMVEDEEHEQMVMVIEMDTNCNSEDGGCLFQNEQINSCDLIRLNSNLSQGEKERLDSLSDASGVLTMLSTTADALSFVDTLCDKWDPRLGHADHQNGWWFARTTDGVADEERLFNDCTRHDTVLEEISRDAVNSYKYIHDRTLDEYDKVNCPSSVAKSDIIRHTYSRLESCLPSSVKTDHRSLCLDTIPSLSTICQSEENRKANQLGRRSRRFLHYLDTIGLHLDSKIRERLIRTSLAES